MSVFPDDIEFNDYGRGPTILFLPGSFGTGAGWKPILNELCDRFRFVTTSLLGYGATSDRRDDYENTTQQQTNVIDTILEKIAVPTNIVAHSYGGLCALAHVMHGSIQPASLTLMEANPYVERSRATPAGGVGGLVGGSSTAPRKIRLQ